MRGTGQPGITRDVACAAGSGRGAGKAECRTKIVWADWRVIEINDAVVQRAKIGTAAVGTRRISRKRAVDRENCYVYSRL